MGFRASGNPVQGAVLGLGFLKGALGFFQGFYLGFKVCFLFFEGSSLVCLRVFRLLRVFIRAFRDLGAKGASEPWGVGGLQGSYGLQGCLGL